MTHRAKLFMNGRSQAVRLPAIYRFDCEEVYIHRDIDTGDVILSRKPGDWDSFFKLSESMDVPQDFMDSRDNESLEERDLL